MNSFYLQVIFVVFWYVFIVFKFGNWIRDVYSEVNQTEQMKLEMKMCHGLKMNDLILVWKAICWEAFRHQYHSVLHNWFDLLYQVVNHFDCRKAQIYCGFVRSIVDLIIRTVDVTNLLALTVWMVALTFRQFLYDIASEYFSI